MPSPLASHRLIVVTGKGGVGKTTVAAGLGAALATRGRRALVLEVDPRENAHRMLGLPPSGGEIAEATPGLFLQNLTPRAVLDRVVAEQVRFGPVVRRILQSEVYRHFADGAPGLKELAVLGHALRLLRGIEPLQRAGRRAAGSLRPALDAVVLDAPATGHGLALLRAPRLVADTIRSGPFGELAGELAAFLDQPGQCAVVVAAAAEEIPMQEALELLAQLRQQPSRQAAAVVVNALYPPLPAGARGEQAEPDDPRGRLWQDRRAVNDRELGRLRAAWSGPVVELPLLPLPSGPVLLARLQPPLAALLEGA